MVPPPGDLFLNITPCLIWPLAPCYENMTSSTKPEVHSISQRRQRRIEPRPQATSTNNLVKFGRVVFELCVWTDTIITVQQQQEHPFNGPLSGTTRVSRYQKGKTNLDLLEQEIVSGTSISAEPYANPHLAQTGNDASTPLLSFYRPDALPAAQPTASKHY